MTADKRIKEERPHAMHMRSGCEQKVALLPEMRKADSVE